MKTPKDNFSSQSGAYAKFRPHYPDELFDYLYTLIEKYDKVWDCGTGNGQAAGKLAEKFNTVYATDISEKQIENAVREDNINYTVCRAEEAPFENNTFDLVTVAQAIHWFDFDKFYNEVRRTAKENGVIAVWCYNLLRIDKSIDELTDRFYFDVTGKYWDKERKYVDEKYWTIPFPFGEIAAPEFTIKLKWKRDNLLGYFNSWSAVQNYIKLNSTNPVELITENLYELWNDNEEKDVTFPLYMRAGRI